VKVRSIERADWLYLVCWEDRGWRLSDERGSGLHRMGVESGSGGVVNL